jgi:hypothetical protein
MPDTITTVIDNIVENRRRFEAFCLSLTDEQLDRPVPESTWLVRDFAAHLATLDPIMQQIFETSAAGRNFGETDAGRGFDIDAHNEPLVVERRAWPMAKVFEQAAAERASLVASIRAMTEEQTKNMMWFGGDAKRKAGNIPLGLFMVGWSQHDPIHVYDMLRALPELADDPELRAWLDNPFIAGYQRAMNPAASNAT